MTRGARSRQTDRALAALRARQREPGYDTWHTTRYGRCKICGTQGTIFRHHVVLEQHVRLEGGDPWDLRNSLDVGARCACHPNHHGIHRISRRLIPKAALEFAAELLGRRRASDYMRRYYAP
jgi:hypothetical protein